MIRKSMSFTVHKQVTRNIICLRKLCKRGSYWMYPWLPSFHRRQGGGHFTVSVPYYRVSQVSVVLYCKGTARPERDMGRRGTG